MFVEASPTSLAIQTTPSGLGAPAYLAGGDDTAVALHWPQNRLSLKLLLRFGDRRFDGLDTSMLPISELGLSVTECAS